MLRVWQWLIVSTLAAGVGCGQAQTPVADFATQRERMVKEQIIVRGIATERVLAAMRKVPREEFVPERVREAS